LFDQWKRDELKSYGLSKAQLVRVKKIFEEHKNELNTLPINVSPISQISPISSGPDPQPLSDENLDVYTDEDFDHSIPNQSYYQDLLQATEELHLRLNDT
jgi:hypothetical protein